MRRKICWMLIDFTMSQLVRMILTFAIAIPTLIVIWKKFLFTLSVSLESTLVSLIVCGVTLLTVIISFIIVMLVLCGIQKIIDEHFAYWE